MYIFITCKHSPGIKVKNIYLNLKMAFLSLEHRILWTTLLPLYNRFMHVQTKKSMQLGLVYEISRTILFYLPTYSHSVHLLWCLGVGIWQELGVQWRVLITPWHRITGHLKSSFISIMDCTLSSLSIWLALGLRSIVARL